MKIIAAAFLAALAAVSPAAAQQVTRTVTTTREAPVVQRTVTRHVVTRSTRYGGMRRVCSVRYRHGNRIRTCRMTRY